MFTASEVETATLAAGINPGLAGLLGGMTGGIAQAYATMGAWHFDLARNCHDCVDPCVLVRWKTYSLDDLVHGPLF